MRRVWRKKNGADKFGIVTSGRGLSLREVEKIAEVIRSIRTECGIIPCASFGSLSGESFQVLKDAGLTRYHHNLETSRRFYPEIVTTHEYQERIDTILRAKDAGLEVCSGGIFGIGEAWQDRIDLAFLLNELDVDSIALNFLVPIKGTPLGEADSLSQEDVLRIIALFRFVLKNKKIKVIAGRESIFKKCSEKLFSAGCAGIMTGGYLTTQGVSVKEDMELIDRVRSLWKNE